MKEKDPLWLNILRWGAVMYFFAFPIMTFVITEIPSQGKLWSTAFFSRDNLKEMQLAVTALVTALAGLHSFDVKK